MAVANLDKSVSTSGRGSHGSKSRFISHFLEMIVAMIVGMAVLGVLVSTLFALLGHANLYHYPALRAVLMATYMTIGMTLWMRHRRCSWPLIREMAAAMFAPFLVLLAPFWVGLIPGGLLLVCGHLLMLPAMLAAMLYRRADYSQDHARHESSALGSR